jgi:hypothetical protein
MGNPFSVNVLGGVNLGDELTKAVEGRRRLTREDEAKQEKLNLQGAIKGAVGGDPDSIETLYTLNPQYAQMFEKRNDQKSQKLGAENAALSKEAETSWGLKWSQSTTPEQFAALEQEALNNPLIDFDEDDLGVDKNHSNLAVNSMLFQNLGKDAYKQFYNQGGKGGSNIGKVSPKDFTVDSLSKYEKSGQISDLNRYTPKTIKVGGVEHKLDPESQKWIPAVDATAKPLSIQASALADIEADKKSRVDFGSNRTKWNSGRPKFRSSINSAKASQSILETTADQIKNHIGGLTTEYGASLSGIPGSEAKTLKNLLNTLKAHSAFSTLTDLKNSGGTLGAISEAELVLLESKLGALDQRGDSSELVRVVDQILNSNLDSIDRLESEFGTTDLMYSGSFDDFQSGVTKKPHQQEKLSDQDLISKYGG